MERSPMTAPREQTLQRLHAESENLNNQISRLQEQADSAQGGIRLYRSQRVEQFRAREEDLLGRLLRIEAGHADTVFETEAEDLSNEFRETAELAVHTIRQIQRV